MQDLAVSSDALWRPHVKTHKTIEGALMQVSRFLPPRAGPAGAVGVSNFGVVVSTVAELELLATHPAFADILYGVGIEPSKLPRLLQVHLRLRSRLHLLVDSLEAIDCVAVYIHGHADLAAACAAKPVGIFVKVDCGYGRCGATDPKDVAALAAAAAGNPLFAFSGLYSHSGDAYNAGGTPAEAREAAAATASAEVAAIVAMAAAVAARAGLRVPVISVGSTPAAAAIARLERGRAVYGCERVCTLYLAALKAAMAPSVGGGVVSGGGGSAAEDASRAGALAVAIYAAADAAVPPPRLELHPGNYVLYDRQQVASGSCDEGDIACYVLARIVGVYPARNEAAIDAGGCALHKDGGGLRDGTWGHVLGHPSVVVKRLSQEVGILGTADGSSLAAALGSAVLAPLRLGAVVRIVPNHSCMAAAQHAAFHLVDEAAAVLGPLPSAPSAAVNSDVGGTTGAGSVSSGPGPHRLLGTWIPAKFW